MDEHTLHWAASLGVGGILAAGMFLIYRKDAIAAQKRLAEATDHTIALAGRLLDQLGTIAAHTAMVDRLLQRIDAYEHDHEEKP